MCSINFYPGEIVYRANSQLAYIRINTEMSS